MLNILRKLTQEPGSPYMGKFKFVSFKKMCLEFCLCLSSISIIFFIILLRILLCSVFFYAVPDTCEFTFYYYYFIISSSRHQVLRVFILCFILQSLICLRSQLTTLTCTVTLFFRPLSWSPIYLSYLFRIIQSLCSRMEGSPCREMLMILPCFLILKNKLPSSQKSKAG